MESEIKALAAKTLQLEGESLIKIAQRLNHSFDQAINCIHQSKGRVIVSGIGKSANIAQKAVATFNSTGTPAIFMHAADAIHGDLGNVQKDDVVILLSKSGNTPEIKALIPLIKGMGNTIIAVVGNLQSQLALMADIVLDVEVEKEACPNNLAPTSSTTAQLGMTDALAVALLHLKGFSPADFAKYHPGGTLGKQLYLTCGELCAQNEKPQVNPMAEIEEVIMKISSGRLGAVAVIDGHQLLGIITDGDIRRMLSKGIANLPKTAAEMMTHNPKSVTAETLAIKAKNIMEAQKITQLIVTENEGYAGIIHLHDLLREGII